MKSHIIAFLVLVVAFPLMGQKIQIPTNYQLNKIEDYEPYKDSVKLVARWLIEHSLKENPDIRDQANRFLFHWISGAPYTHIK